MRINNLMEVHQALCDDIITPGQAIEIVCKSLNMIDLRFKGEVSTKDYILSEIEGLNTLVSQGSEIPIFFGQGEGDFSFNKLIKRDNG